MADMVSPYLMMGRKVAQNPFDNLGLDTGLEPQAVANQQQVMEQAPSLPPLSQPPQVQQPMQQSQPGYLGTSPQNEEERQIIDRLRQQQQMALEAQAGGLQTAEQRLKEALAKPKEIDWSPLVALVDKWSGGNLLQAYQRPEDKDKQVQQLQEAVLKARGGLSDAAIRATEKELGFLNAKEDKAYKQANLEYTREAAAAAKQNRLQAKEQDRVEKLVNNLGKDSQYKKVNSLTEYLDGVNEYIDLVKEYRLRPITDNAAMVLQSALSNLGIKYKNAAELGAITGPDWKIITGAIPDATSMSQSIYAKTGLTSGADSIINVMQKEKARAKKAGDLSLDDLSTRYKKLNADEYIQPLSERFNKAYAGSSEAPPAFDKAALNAEMERRRKAKAAGGTKP